MTRIQRSCILLITSNSKVSKQAISTSQKITNELKVVKRACQGDESKKEGCANDQESNFLGQWQQGLVQKCQKNFTKENELRNETGGGQL